MPTHAPIIAIIGSDGSGKTTTGSALFQWMRCDRKVAFCHLGKQTGSVGRMIASIPLVGSYADRRISHATEQTRLAAKTRLAPALVAFMFSMRRVSRFWRMLKLHRKEITVLTDRYPQIAVAGGLDGPALTFLPDNSRIVQELAALEGRLYEWMARHAPDLVIRLNVDLDTAISRKPDHRRSTLARKIADLPNLSFGTPPILDLDSTEPFDIMIAKAKGAITAIFNHQDDTKPVPPPIVALIGCDGSGKSTVSRDLTNIISLTTPAGAFYLGLGSGDLGRRIGRIPLIGIWLKGSLAKRAKATHSPAEKIPGPVTAVVVFAFSLIRYRRFLKMKQAWKSGMTIVTDRYPQVETPGKFDGLGYRKAYSAAASSQRSHAKSICCMNVWLNSHPLLSFFWMSTLPRLSDANRIMTHFFCLKKSKLPENPSSARRPS